MLLVSIPSQVKGRVSFRFSLNEKNKLQQDVKIKLDQVIVVEQDETVVLISKKHELLRVKDDKNNKTKRLLNFEDDRYLILRKGEESTLGFISDDAQEQRKYILRLVGYYLPLPGID